MKDLGFTMGRVEQAVDYAKIWAAGKPVEAADPKSVAQSKAMLNLALANNWGVTAYPRDLTAAVLQEELAKRRAVDRSGKPYPSGGLVCGFDEEVQRYCYNVGASLAQTYGHFPALKGALIHTEFINT